VGQHAELRDQIKWEGGVELFYMCNSESFLTHAKRYIRPTVQQQAIEEVAGVL